MGGGGREARRLRGGLRAACLQLSALERGSGRTGSHSFFMQLAWQCIKVVPFPPKRVYNLCLSDPHTPVTTLPLPPQALYRLTDASMDKLVGCTEDMCSTSWLPRGIDSPREYSSH